MPFNVNSPAMIDYSRVLAGRPQASTPGEVFLLNDPNRTVIEASLANHSSSMARRLRELTHITELSIKQELAN
eukprot:15633215-Heterocapsa_arctica.AAC.1